MPTILTLLTHGVLGMRSFLLCQASLVLVGFLCFGATVQAQNPSGQAAEPVVTLPRPPDEPRSLYSPLLPEGPARQIVPDRYFEEDPLLDLPRLPAIGWFAGVEASVVDPHVKNKLRNTVPFAGRLDLIALPSAPLDWTVSPRFELGYRLPSGFGELSLAYRFLSAQGSQSSEQLLGPANLSSRLDVNIADFDYSSREISLGENWTMKWTVGGRLAFLYFDSRASQGFAVPGAGSFGIEQRTTNFFAGFGPHAGLELTRHIQGTGLSLIGKADFATMLGRIHQNFLEASSVPVPNSPFSTSELRVSGSQNVPMATTDAGIGWQPPAYPFAQFFVGYHFEYLWNAGRLSTSGSRGEIYDQGVTARAEFVF